MRPDTLPRRVFRCLGTFGAQVQELGTPEIGSWIGVKQKRFNTPQRVIDAAVHKAMGSSLASIERIMKGVDNEVYAVQTHGGHHLIVRISHNEESEARFAKERWAIERCADAGLPVSRVISVDTIEHKGELLGISVQTKLPGVPLDELVKHDRSSKNLDELFRRAGTILSSINSIATNGFGELDRNGDGEYDSIGEMFSPSTLNRDYCMEVARAVNLERQIVDRALEELYECRSTYPEVPPRLIHNDFAPRHVLIRDDQISGVVDFEDAQGGDPALEFARWEFFFQGQYPLDCLKEGYENIAVFGNNFERRLHVWRVRVALGQLIYCHRQESRLGVEVCKDRLTKDVTHFN